MLLRNNQTRATEAPYRQSNCSSNSMSGGPRQHAKVCEGNRQRYVHCRTTREAINEAAADHISGCARDAPNKKKASKYPFIATCHAIQYEPRVRIDHQESTKRKKGCQQGQCNAG